MNADTYRDILWLLDEASEAIDDKQGEVWAAVNRARHLVTDLWLQGLSAGYTLTPKGEAALA